MMETGLLELQILVGIKEQEGVQSESGLWFWEERVNCPQASLLDQKQLPHNCSKLQRGQGNHIMLVFPQGR